MAQGFCLRHGCFATLIRGTTLAPVNVVAEGRGAVRQRSRIGAVAIVCLLLSAACSSSGVGETATTSGANSNPASTDSVAAEAIETDALPDDEPTGEPLSYETESADVLFDQTVVHTFEIELPEAALAELDADPAAEEYVEGSLLFNGERLDAIGVRYKGSVGAFLGCTAGPQPFQPSGPKTCTKQSLKLKINWNGADTEFFGQRRIQLHSMNLDTSLMRDRLSYLLFAEAGVAAPRSTHARVVINGEYVGVFALIEQIDGRFTRDRFDDGKGNLYKEAWPFGANGETRPSFQLIAALRTNEDEDPSSEIIESFARELLDAGAATDEEAARRVLSQWTDVEAFVAYAVVDRAIHHDDGPFHWYCIGGPCEPHNFYFYEEPASRRVHIIPWDLDNALQGWTPDDLNPVTAIPDAFGDTSSECEPFPFGAFGLLQRSAGCDPLVAAWALLDDEFERIDADFRSGPFAIDSVTVNIEAWRELIAPHVAEAAALHDDAPGVAEWNASVDQLLADIAAEPSRQES